MLRISNCSLLLIYLPRKDERLSRPGWLKAPRGCAPSPENFLTLELKMVGFGAFWVLFFTTLAAVQAKTDDLGSWA